MKNVLLISALAAGSMYGAVLVPGAGTWVSFANPNGGGGSTSNGVINGVTGYWNNDSIEGTDPNCANIGCLLTGSSQFAGYVYPSGPTPPITSASPAFLAASAAGGATDFAIQGIPGGPAEIIAEFTGTATTNWVGWYDEAYFTGANIGTAFSAANTDHWGVIFTGSASNGQTSVFTPTSTFGLWLLNGNNTLGTGPAFSAATVASELNARGLFSDTTKNGTADAVCAQNDGASCGDVGGQHFALFASSAAAGNSLPVDYFVGYEDLRVNPANGTVGDRDYQDGAFKLKVVPEPGYYVLLSLGLAGLGLRRRMNKTSVN